MLRVLTKLPSMDPLDRSLKRFNAAESRWAARIV